MNSAAKAELIVSTDTIAAQFSEHAPAAAPNGQPETPENCKFEWVEQLPAGARRGPGGGTRGQWLSAAVARLSERPGTWAMIMSYESGATAAGRVTALRKQFPGLEFVSRKQGEKGGAVYARVPAATTS